MSGKALFAGVILSIAMASAAFGAESGLWSQTICVPELPPDGMVITATGDSSGCNSPCSARRIDKVFGKLMKICSGQPIPDGWQIDGTGSTPQCRCLGDAENTFFIRRVRPDADEDLSH